jgi:hypothetical protein
MQQQQVIYTPTSSICWVKQGTFVRNVFDSNSFRKPIDLPGDNEINGRYIPKCSAHSLVDSTTMASTYPNVVPIRMWMIWRVIDYVIWSKTSHVFHMASYRLRQLIKNLSYIWCGELSMKTIDRKLVMWLIWWVIDNGNWSKTRHIFDVASYRWRQLIENSSCDW